MISASIEIPDEKVFEIFIAEEKGMMNNRASYKTAKKAGKTIVEITADDATALRAVTNSVCKALIIYEKTEKAIGR